MEKQKPGIKRACEYLRKLKEETNSAALPSIRALAKASDVSFVTMWKAVKHLQENAFITSSSDGNKFIFSDTSNNSQTPLELKSDHETESDATKNRSGLRQNITDRIYKDIVTGRFSTNEKLPSCKELQLQYGVSFVTLKKSLNDLVDQQILELRTSGYFVPLITGNTGHARIVVIGCGWEDGRLWVDHQDKNYFRAIESECIRMNIQLDVIVHYRKYDRLQFVHSATCKEYDLDNRTILGYVFIVANLDSNPEEVLERLVRLKRHVAVLDVVGGWTIPQCARGNNLIKFFTTTASVLPAKRVAQYLIGKGHRKIAFFSPFHLSLWSQRRFATIEEMLTKSGFPDSLIPFVYNDCAYQWDYLNKSSSQEDLRTVIAQYIQWKKDARGVLFKRFGNLGYNIVKYMTDSNCASGEIYEKMVPLFQQALDDQTITAWVMANDFTATMAIDFLKERNVPIPGNLAVVSFDNTLDAMEYQLTSYDFNNSGIVNLILRYILAPQTIKHSRRNQFLEVDGALVVRKSG